MGLYPTSVAMWHVQDHMTKPTSYMYMIRHTYACTYSPTSKYHFCFQYLMYAVGNDHESLIMLHDAYIMNFINIIMYNCRKFVGIFNCLCS